MNTFKNPEIDICQIIAYSCLNAANFLNAAMIIVITISGKTALDIAK